MAIATATAITGIDVHCYLVKEPDRAIQFYRDVLGLPLTRNLDPAADQLADMCRTLVAGAQKIAFRQDRLFDKWRCRHKSEGRSRPAGCETTSLAAS